MRVAFYTLGCKVNQFETHSLCEMFREKGAKIVSFDEKADLYVVNTCAVTSKATYQSRQIMRRIRRNNPTARIIATGCYAQVASQEILDALSWDVCLVGNDQKHLLPSLALNKENCLEFYVGDVNKATQIAPFTGRKPMGRTRAYLKIQDGCNAFCSYCIVPYARGRSRSLPKEMIHEQLRLYEQDGIKEVVLTGIHVGMYGKDLEDGVDLLDLLKEISRTYPYIRFRLSSIEPNEISHEMLLWAKEANNFAHHWHIPLQSGSDKILSAMNRHYNAELYKELIMKTRSLFPDAAIGADVLLGFPGEKEIDFKKTIDLIDSLPLTYVHAFPYSKRPFTQASGMPEIATKAEKSQRVKAVRALGEEKKLRFYSSLTGTTHECLVEKRDKATGLMKGTTSNYIPVHILNSENFENLENQMVNIEISHVKKNKVFGLIKL